MADLSIVTPIEYLKGVGPQKADVLKKELQLFTIGDLLQYYPFRYIDRTAFHKIRELHAQMVGAQVVGRLISVQEVGEKRGRRLIGQFRDDTGSMELVWFQSLSWLKKSLTPGSAYIVYGKPSEFNGQISMTHPEMELFNAQEKKVGNLTMQPVYSSTEKLKKFNLDTKGIQRLQQTALETVYRSLRDPLPDYILQKHRLLASPPAPLSTHLPPRLDAPGRARRRLKFHAVFFTQLPLLRHTRLNTHSPRAHRFDQVAGKFHTFFNERLPLPLTHAQ